MLRQIGQLALNTVKSLNFWAFAALGAACVYEMFRG